MPRGKKSAAKPKKRPIERYEHKDKTRINNPPVGLVTAKTDPPLPTHRVFDYIQPVPTVKPGKDLDYDPHLDPQLVWAGKKEHSSFEVPTVSLHVHETIDPRTIMEAVRRRNGNGLPAQPSLFERPEEKLPLRDAIDFYKHSHGWSNRLIAGDSLLVMNSLLEKEGMAGQVQMVYVDPPYGVEYRSNFQPFVNKRDVRDRKDEDLTQEPEMIQAFRDTWQLGIHSYLTYLRDRLLLARELLHESGSCFVQISDENTQHVREICDEVFGVRNFFVSIFVRKKGSQRGNEIRPVNDYLLWYCKERAAAKRRFLYSSKLDAIDLADEFDYIEFPDGRREPTSAFEPEDLRAELGKGAKLYIPEPLTAGGEFRTQLYPVSYDGRVFRPPANNCWKFSEEGMNRIIAAGRIHVGRDQIRFKKYHTDFPYQALSNLWNDLAGARDKIYVVQTATKAVQRCVLMTTEPGDLVFDPTCGSGTTAYVAEQWGRRWITCDTSRVATTLAKQRLMTAEFDYYELAHSEEGVGSGFRYKTVPHTTSTSIAGDEPPQPEALYDQPSVNGGTVRVAGPFTVEAVPAPTVRSLEDIELGDAAARTQESLADFRHAPTPLLDASVGRKGATLRHTEWRDELLKTGLRGKGGHQIDFSRVEPMAGTRWLHSDAETRGAKPERVVISFGPEYSLLESRQVELAWEEARTLSPKPAILVFAAFEFDPEAAKDIDGMTKEKTGMTFLTAQMNADLLTADLKKKRASNQGFWLVGRPDVEVRRATSEQEKQIPHHRSPKSGDRVRDDSAELYVAEVRGFDYYDTRTGMIESGNAAKIAMWLLDTVRWPQPVSAAGFLSHG